MREAVISLCLPPGGDAGVDGATGGGVAGGFAEPAVGLPAAVLDSPPDEPAFASQRGGTSVSLATT